MKNLVALLFILSSFNLAFAQEFDALYEQVKQDFESKPYFFNEAINQHRDNLQSSFVKSLYGEDYNNSRPLSETQLKRLPDAVFISKKVFTLAMKGRERLLKAGKIEDHPLLVVADMSLHSRARRLYVMDIKSGEMLMNTWVSHASGSDPDHDGFADVFSNGPSSKQSSAGFLVTDTAPYNGRWGHSLRLRGLDPKLNSNVFSRAIVFHGWNTLGAHEASWGKSSTSEGCLMVSMLESGKFWGLSDVPLHKLLIDTVKGGALVFTYTDIEEDNYILQSEWIKREDIITEK